MKEIYCSSDNAVSVDNQTVYSIYEMDNEMLEIRSVCADPNTVNYPIRVSKDQLPKADFSNLCRIGELTANALDGALNNAQVFFKGKWYSMETINKIQAIHEDMNWKRYV